jgi:hypothetical protein
MGQSVSGAFFSAHQFPGEAAVQDAELMPRLVRRDEVPRPLVLLSLPDAKQQLAGQRAASFLPSFFLFVRKTLQACLGASGGWGACWGSVAMQANVGESP